MAKSVLCIATDGFEEIELITPVDVLRRANVDVVIASLHGGTITGRCGIKIEPDADLANLDVTSFDVLLLPGGPGVKDLRNDGRAALLAADFRDSAKWIAAICAAPLILKDADLLKWHQFTAHSSTRDELPDALDERVVKDGMLLTSRGAGTALDFGLALVEILAGEEAAAEVSKAIMA